MAFLLHPLLRSPPAACGWLSAPGVLYAPFPPASWWHFLLRLLLCFLSPASTCKPPHRSPHRRSAPAPGGGSSAKHFGLPITSLPVTSRGAGRQKMLPGGSPLRHPHPTRVFARRAAVTPPPHLHFWPAPGFTVLPMPRKGKVGSEPCSFGFAALTRDSHSSEQETRGMSPPPAAAPALISSSPAACFEPRTAASCKAPYLQGSPSPERLPRGPPAGRAARVRKFIREGSSHALHLRP